MYIDENHESQEHQENSTKRPRKLNEIEEIHLVNLCFISSITFVALSLIFIMSLGGSSYMMFTIVFGVLAIASFVVAVLGWYDFATRNTRKSRLLAPYIKCHNFCRDIQYMSVSEDTERNIVIAVVSIFGLLILAVIIEVAFTPPRSHYEFDAKDAVQHLNEQDKQIRKRNNDPRSLLDR